MNVRFWSKVDKTHGCWNWTAARSSSGYGTFISKGKSYTAHRYAWLETHGYLPSSDVFLCHSCDNKLCVNPEHIHLGTRSDNARDMWARKRGPRRHRVVPVKDYEKIKSRLDSGELQKDIAREYGVTQVCISQIARGLRCQE